MKYASSLALFVALAFSCFSAGVARGDDFIRFARTPDISPDGKLVAFSYLGDIWTVPAKGGTARLITMHQAHEYRPVFSPDGRQIAFASKRHGQYDVFVVGVEGGKPTRLTYDSANDYPCDWTPDGRYILFASTRAVNFPPRYELYKIPVAGGRVERVTTQEGRGGNYSPDGSEIVYMRGPGKWYRKGYRGSANDEIWICDARGGNNRRLTKFEGRDSYPSWSPDHKYIFYVSDKFGPVSNIVRQEITSKPHEGIHATRPPKQITFHREESVRRSRLSRDGRWLVYECGPDLWIVSSNGGTPRRLQIKAFADYKTNPRREVTYTSRATEFAISRNEKYIALVVHGEVFLIPRGGGKATRVTRSPANDHGLTWAPDSRSLVFLSDRDGEEDVYVVSSDDKAHPQLVEAHQFKVKRLTNSARAEIGVMFSPNGRYISFLAEGKLYTMRPDGSHVNCIVPDQMVIDYDWSPDSRWLCYARLDGSYASELYIIPASGATPANPPRNVTRYSTYNAHITWSRRGNRIAFLSDRGIGADRNVYVMYLQKPAASGAGSSSAIDWEDIHLRVRRVSAHAARRAAISNDGRSVAFRSDSGSEDLWLASTDGSSVKRLTTGNMKPTQIQWSRLSSTILYFRDGGGHLRMLSLKLKSGAVKVPFEARMTIDREKDYLEIFDQSWREMHENFYDPKYHGVDWKAIRARYRPLVKHIALEEDLHALINLMLGELNASHLGIRNSDTKPDAQTAYLGMLFDEKYTGPGLKVTEILRRGPADRRGLKIAPGDIITQIDRMPITADSNLAKILNDKARETVTLELTSNLSNPKDRRHIELRTASKKQMMLLMYERWTRRNAEQVARLSKGKLGYIHIPSMDENGLNRFLRALYSDNTDKHALVLDVRFNGGGYTHDKVLNYLGGTDHTYFIQRHGNKGTVFRASDRKWSKPAILLINNRSFSDAEIFPSAFRTLGLGKLVGVPTGAHVIGTSATQLIDGSIFRLPRTGVFTVNGINMERKGVQPDVFVENHPDELSRGKDTQLQKAVEVMLTDLRTKRNNKGITSHRPPNRPAGTSEIKPSRKRHGEAPSSLRK